MTKQRNRQRQKRNAGVSPLRRQSAPPSVEMTCSLGWAKRTSNGNGRSRSLRDDKQRDKQRQRQVAILLVFGCVRGGGWAVFQQLKQTLLVDDWNAKGGSFVEL